MNNLCTVPLAPPDTFASLRYCKDYIYLGVSYISGSITCFLSYKYCPSKNIRPLGHVLGMLDSFQCKNSPKPENTQ